MIHFSVEGYMMKNIKKLFVLGLVFLFSGWTHSARVLAADVTRSDIETAIRQLQDYSQIQGREKLARVEALVQQTYQQPVLRIHLERQMITVLKSESPWDTKQFICEQLWIMGTDESVPTLAGMLTADQTVEMACYALRNHQSPLASQALIDALGNVKGRSLLSIINLLGDRREERSVPALIRIARSPARGATGSAIAALGKIATEPAVLFLRELRLRRNTPQQLMVAQAYLQSGQELARRGKSQAALGVYRDLFRVNEATWVRRGALLGMMETGGAEVVPVVMGVLRGNDWKLKTAAIANSHLLQGEAVTKQLIVEFQESTPDIQVLLLEAIVEREKSRVLPFLIEAIRSRSVDVRVAAIRELGTHGDRSSVPVLVRVLTGGAGKEETQVASASLRRIQGTGVEEALLQSMEQASGTVRPELIRIISDRKIPGVVDAILRQASDADGEVAKAALKALGLLAGAEHQADLIRILTDVQHEAVRSEAEMALLAVSRKIEGPQQQTRLLIRSYENTRDIETKCSLIRVLGGLASESAFKRIQQSLESKHPKVKEAALRSLVNWPNSRAVEPLFKVFRNTQKETYRVLALRGLVRVLGYADDLPASAVASRYQEILKQTRRTDEKKLILSGLANVRDVQALKLVLTLGEDSSIREEAEQAVMLIVETLPRLALTKKETEKIRKLVTDSTHRKTLEQILQQMNTFSLEGCAWIWLTAGEGLSAQTALPTGTVYFRKTLILPDEARLRQAKVLITADDRYTLYLNGKVVGKGEPWMEAQVYTVTQQMKPGKNVLAVEAANGAVSPAGFIANLHIVGNQGRDRFAVTDASWKASRKDAARWYEKSFDDSSWQSANVLGIYGCEPWGRKVKFVP
jgi:HEAT repeat protein